MEGTGLFVRREAEAAMLSCARLGKVSACDGRVLFEVGCVSLLRMVDLRLNVCGFIVGDLGRPTAETNGCQNGPWSHRGGRQHQHMYV